jgi:hypothetical protein
MSTENNDQVQVQVQVQETTVTPETAATQDTAKPAILSPELTVEPEQLSLGECVVNALETAQKVDKEVAEIALQRRDRLSRRFSMAHPVQLRSLAVLAEHDEHMTLAEYQTVCAKLVPEFATAVDNFQVHKLHGARPTTLADSAGDAENRIPEKFWQLHTQGAVTKYDVKAYFPIIAYAVTYTYGGKLWLGVSVVDSTKKLDRRERIWDAVMASQEPRTLIEVNNTTAATYEEYMLEQQKFVASRVRAAIDKVSSTFRPMRGRHADLSRRWTKSSVENLVMLATDRYITQLIDAQISASFTHASDEIAAVDAEHLRQHADAADNLDFNDPAFVSMTDEQFEARVNKLINDSANYDGWQDDAELVGIDLVNAELLQTAGDMLGLPETQTSPPSSPPAQG